MRQTTKIINRLDKMIEDAINGTFVESGYDETELSRLESRFHQYLAIKETTEEKIEAERAAIKSLVSDISHQTKTPLANVLLYAQLLEEQCTDEALNPYVRQIRVQAEKLQFLIQSLVKLSRLESGMVESNPISQSVELLIEGAVEGARGRAKTKQIAMEVKGDVHMSALYDLRWTLEALGNLLDNAIKYSPAGSTVTVSVRSYEMFVCISVEDKGCGIPEQEQAQIFERFYRGTNAMDEEGNGIGLYFTRMILQKEQGYIKVDSKMGQGSCFQVFLKRI